MSQPYYDEAGITIWHGDCREVLPGLARDRAQLVLTDPPYPNNAGHFTEDVAAAEWVAKEMTAAGGLRFVREQA